MGGREGGRRGECERGKDQQRRGETEAEKARLRREREKERVESRPRSGSVE